jgi:hypothetical protein
MPYQGPENFDTNQLTPDKLQGISFVSGYGMDLPMQLLAVTIHTMSERAELDAATQFPVFLQTLAAHPELENFTLSEVQPGAWEEYRDAMELYKEDGISDKQVANLITSPNPYLQLTALQLTFQRALEEMADACLDVGQHPYAIGRFSGIYDAIKDAIDVEIDCVEDPEREAWEEEWGE